MTFIGIGMNLLLAALLVATLVLGLRLNRRLQALRDSHDGFEAAVRELYIAAQRAEQGLADLRAATDEATDTLSDRIEKGRALATKLERLVSAAPELPHDAGLVRPLGTRSMPAAMPVRETAAEQRLAALLSAARSRLQAEAEPRVEVPPPHAPSRLRNPPRFASAIDDDLFEDAPTARIAAFGGRG